MLLNMVEVKTLKIFVVLLWPVSTFITKIGYNNKKIKLKIYLKMFAVVVYWKNAFYVVQKAP